LLGIGDTEIREGSMTTHDYRNETTQAERRKEVERDTYLRRAQADAETELGGRFKKPITVIGAGVPEYPRQPEGSPWREPPPSGPDEIGYVDAMPDTRTVSGLPLETLSGSGPAPVPLPVEPTDGGGEEALSSPPQLLSKEE